MQKSGNKNFGALAALFANIIFGFSFLFSKLALNYANPLIVLQVRFTLAFVVLLCLALFGVIKINLKGKQVLRLILMAVAQPLLYFLLELYGINFTTSAVSGVIISLVPVGVIILSGFVLKEKATRTQIICSVCSILAVSGISVISSGGGRNSIKGILLLVGAVCMAAVFNILSRLLSKEFTPIEKTFTMFLVGAVGFNAIAFAVFKDKTLSMLTQAAVNTEFWVAIVYLSIVSSIGAFMLYNYATAKISAVRAASFSNIITVVSLLAGVLILKEKITLLEFILCIVIILSVYGVNKKGQV